MRFAAQNVSTENPATARRRGLERISDLGEHGRFQLRDARFIALVERPLLDALGAHQSGLRQYLQMLAHGGLADAELLGDQHPADPVLDKVAVDLRAKMRPRAFQPFQDQQPPIAGERAKSRLDVVIEKEAILLIS